MFLCFILASVLFRKNKLRVQSSLNPGSRNTDSLLFALLSVKSNWLKWLQVCTGQFTSEKCNNADHVASAFSRGCVMTSWHPRIIVSLCPSHGHSMYPDFNSLWVFHQRAIQMRRTKGMEVTTAGFGHSMAQGPAPSQTVCRGLLSSGQKCFWQGAYCVGCKRM